MSDYAEFRQAELDGWNDPERALRYVRLFARAADRAIAPLLAAAGVAAGQKVLDLCCGQGNVTRTLVARGCEVTGADFSPAMLAIARERVPGAEFVEANAEALDFADGTFDAVVSNFGICHVPDQPRALAEAARVLKPGSRFAMSVWCGPDQSPSFATLYGAVKEHGNPEISVPPGPDFHQFASPDIAHALFSEAGFTDIGQTTADCAWDLDDPDGLFQVYARGTVRAAMLLASQPAENLAAIRKAMADHVREHFANGARWRCPVPAAVVSGLVMKDE